LTFLFAEYLSRKNAPEKLSDIINKVDLIDHNGQLFKSATLKNKASLLFFGFTNCPEICPTTLADLSEITKEVTLNDDSINIIFVTLDPKRDNTEHLKDYIEYFDGNIVGVTGNKIEIKEFADNWGVFYETIKTTDNNYTLNHTATVFMIDKLGNFRGTISWGENESSIIQKINNLRILN
jgi:protein SCO1/2